MPIYEFPKNKTVYCIDCGGEMDAGLSCYTFEGKPICTDCEKFCFDCLCKFIYKVGKRNKDQINIFEV